MAYIVPGNKIHVWPLVVGGALMVLIPLVAGVCMILGSL